MILHSTPSPARLIFLFAMLFITGEPAISQDTDLMAAKRIAEAFFEARVQQVLAAADPQVEQKIELQADATMDEQDAGQVSQTKDGQDGPAKGATVAQELTLTYQSAGEVQTPLFVFQQARFLVFLRPWGAAGQARHTSPRILYRALS